VNNLDSALVERLRELLAKATPGPWDVDTVRNEGDYGDGGPDCRTGFDSAAIVDSQGRALLDSLNCDYRIACVHDDEGHARDEPSFRNAELIVAAVNALPALLDELDTLRTRLAGGGDDAMVAFVKRIAAQDPIFAKGHDKQTIHEARSLIAALNSQQAVKP